MMSTTEFALLKQATPNKTILPISSKSGREANRIFAVLIEYLNRSEIESARSELQLWLDSIGWRRGSNQELASLSLLLMKELGDRMIMQAQPCEITRNTDSFGREGFTTSIHFSLLTAAVLRQREQIRQLLALVESLSRRLA